MGKERTTGGIFWDILQNQIETDDEPGHKIGKKILGMYEEASPSERETIDDVFIAICGYSVSTLKEQM